ncbi:MAG: two-component regulator propeller domain-containing protein [bacterium]
MLFFLLVDVLSAQITNERVEKITVNEGLSQNYIYDIFQDSRGFLWIGTKDGLNRYDGYNFKVYRSVPHDSTSLSNNNVQVITEDIAGNLWVATIGGGLNRFNRTDDNFTRFLHNPLDSNSISDNFITSIYCYDTLGVWFGSNKGHIDYFNRQLRKFTHYNFEQFSVKNFGENNILKLYQDSKNILWIASGLGGFDCLDLSSGKVDHLIDSKLPPDILDQKYFSSFLVDSNDIFWIACFSGLIKFNSRTKQTEILQFKNQANQALKIFTILKSREGYLWLISQNDVIRFDPSSNSYDFIIKEYPENFTSASFLDSSGILWIGSQGYGIVKIDPGDLRFNSKPGSFLSFIYGRVYEKFEKTGMDLINYNERGKDFCSVIRDNSGNIWFAKHFWGLYKISKDTKTITRFNTGEIGLSNLMRFIDRVFQDRNGGIWVTTIGGIDKFNETDKSFKHYQIYTDSTTDKFAVNKSGYPDITAIYQDKKNIFWLGTPTLGLVRFDPTIQNVKYYHYDSGDKFSLNNNFILTIAEDPIDPENILWIGTEGGGLNRFDKTNEKFTHFTIDEGLPNNVVYGILSDKNGFLWISTNKGISKFDPVNFTFRNYDISDGLQSNEFNRNEYFKTEEGEMFFGGISGFNHFYPEKISVNKTIPQLVFTDFQLSRNSISFGDNNPILTKPIWETDKIILHYYDNIITFEFAALEFSSPGKNKYAYKLEGLHEDWIDNGNSRMATFTNLDPGEYVFRVKGSNADGIWNEKGISLRLIILPPFWQTWWFMILALLIILGSTGYFVKRKITLVKLERFNQQEFSRRLIESQEMERKRIAMELHDSIGQNLLIIKNKLLSGIRNFKKEEKDLNPFEEATKIAGETLKEIREISYHLRPQHLDHLGLTMAIEEIIEKVSNSTEVKIGFSFENINNTLSKENEINFYRIVQEGLNNIIKHSGATEAFVTIKKENNTIELTIKDNGTGIKSDEISKGKGLGVSSMFERARMLGGELKISNIGNNGTLLSLKISV